MLSPMLEGWLTFGDDESALRAALQLPSLAAAELERKNAFSPRGAGRGGKIRHDRLSDDAGRRAAAGRARRKAFYERVAQLTGLPLDVVTQTRGFVDERLT